MKEHRTRIVYKIFHLRIRPLIIIQISEGSSVLDQNGKNYHKKSAASKVKSFPISIFGNNKSSRKLHTEN